jgi:hypothetical protein
VVNQLVHCWPGVASWLAVLALLGGGYRAPDTVSCRTPHATGALPIEPMIAEELLPAQRRRWSAALTSR